ncbi:energy-dependent translational throttle protein EttA [Rickettsiales endosymbiont of Stachyamoeba lipophora]|uniref:energy-dependent translational throttle protein EttA n=1 Tax=Rickettsiales endosymbiont of Stachyamoeba lipophora TaxID=2486578 RepID=UPI000F64AED9|nr:energy-dependent translational throttle protein EttA [Rickettsiales endosymbiont of Stachyamoeba lipophora]AZL14967.1 energy-dependent translational throttle protein EttA [Rickettsiales endosymbiont of Stachyamoeba lipophora]
MSNHYIYVMKGLSKFYGAKQILKDVWLSFYPGAKIGVLGHNGSGKSTLLKIMAGIDKEYTGEAWAANGVKIGYLPQEPHLDETKNVFDNIQEALRPIKDLVDEFYAVSARFAEELSDDEMNSLIERQGELQEKIDAVDGWELERRIEIAMDALSCPPKDGEIAKLSGGEKRRVALCKLLLEEPDMLLLDEPTNHLDAESISWLEQFLREYRGTVVIITHDRYFLDNVTGWILELDRGHGIPYEGNYTSWLSQKEKRLAQEEKEDSAKRKFLQKELEWVNASPKARQAKSKARLTQYEKLASEQRDSQNGLAQIIIPNGPRLGNNVINVDHISKKFGNRDVIKDLSFTITPSAILGIIGPNGAGKSTLFKTITGQEQPDGGKIDIGESVKLGYVDQSRDKLNDTATVWEEVAEGREEITLGDTTVKSRAYVSAFNFKGSDQQKKIGLLSGGERNRVHLAKMLKEGANVILLDEPTNDLDIETLRALEEAILDFAGCVLVISHDRWFLDRICTHILAFEGDGHAEFVPGNYQDYEQDLIRRKGENAVKKFKYKKIAH